MQQGFEAKASDATDLESLNRAVRAEVRRFGFNAHAAGVLHPAAPPTGLLLVDWPPAWLEMYAAQGFAADDVVVAEAARSPVPFTWREIRARQPGASLRIFAAAESFGWRDGSAVPVHGPGSDRGIVSLAAPAPVTESARGAVEPIALLAYQHARRIAARHPEPPVYRLTPRERAALELVARGKDDAEIARLLSIARTTAHVHVERAKRRLGAATRAHAVAVAIVQRLI